jgi:hypothetical protein
VARPAAGDSPLPKVDERPLSNGARTSSNPPDTGAGGGLEAGGLETGALERGALETGVA